MGKGAFDLIEKACTEPLKVGEVPKTSRSQVKHGVDETSRTITGSPGFRCHGI